MKLAFGGLVSLLLATATTASPNRFGLNLEVQVGNGQTAPNYYNHNDIIEVYDDQLIKLYFCSNINANKLSGEERSGYKKGAYYCTLGNVLLKADDLNGEAQDGCHGFNYQLAKHELYGSHFYNLKCFMSSRFDDDGTTPLIRNTLASQVYRVKMLETVL